uniref:Death on curing protein n=1 Tax=uncultured bacterium contig00014 TaxID=1181505 RepID=A0A806K0W9_9BACT|nr:death on curing protein [uncultured bacterium contig00014]
MSESSFDGQYLHKTIPAMAAAYAYHLCQNHPFIDGNKRAALASSLVFLDINGYEFNCKDEILYKKIMAVAKGETRKEELIKFYEKYSRTKNRG